MTIPQQLVVPICVGFWMGKAIMDTGASYTLLHENLMKQLAIQDQLQPWSCCPLYLANGKGESPLGWINTTIHLHGKAITLPVVVRPSQALAYPIVLGLDFIFFSGLQINVSVIPSSLTLLKNIHFNLEMPVNPWLTHQP